MVAATLGPENPSGSESPDVLLARELPPELADHPRYRIVRRLGIGGMGSVYLAEHRVMDRPVALKVIRPDLLGNEDLVERFRREVKAAARLALHPNVVAAYDAEQAGDSHFLVMEFIDGVDLAHLVKSQGPLPCDLACEAVKQAAEGLEHAYQRGMVHRDIKPQNLMRTPAGLVKILDFGLARFASEALPDLVPAAERQTEPASEVTARDRVAPVTLTDMLLGTADYISPEQASAPRSADIRADIYSLGCTLYYLLVGHPPFPDGNLAEKLAAHAERTPRPLALARPDVNLALARVIDRMMAKDRSLRFQRPAEVAEALAPFASAKAGQDAVADVGGNKKSEHAANAVSPTLTETQADRPVPQPAFRTRSRRRWPMVEVLALSLIVGPFFYWALPFVIWWVWPPSADYLYHQAEALMASNRRRDWMRACDQYLDVLDKRYPGNPYSDKTQKWRDKIFLDDAEGRAKILSSDKKLSTINHPKNNAERQFILTNALATDASRRGDDLAAKKHWEEMAHSLKPDDPEGRPWYLLAQQRINYLDAAMEDRRRYFQRQLDAAVDAQTAGRIAEAETIRKMLIEKFGHFTDLNLLRLAQPAVKSPETRTANPRETSSNPSSPPGDDGKTSRADPPHQPKASEDPGATSGGSPKPAPSVDDEADPKPARPKYETARGDRPYPWPCVSNSARRSRCFSGSYVPSTIGGQDAVLLARVNRTVLNETHGVVPPILGVK
jgi:serine/threonine-protein kinase